MFSFRSSQPDGSMRPRNDADSLARQTASSLASDVTITKEKELETKICALYRTIWLGIYQVNQTRGRYHIHRLTELYLGAGMSSYIDKTEINPNDGYRDAKGRGEIGDTHYLGYLRAALTMQALRNLKLFNGISVASLEAVLELLEVYANEIPNVKNMYHYLRGIQVGFRTPTEDDEQVVLENFIPMANQFARRLLHLDARLKVLVSDLEDEFWDKYGAVQGRDMSLVYDMVFPPTKHKKHGISSAGA